MPAPSAIQRLYRDRKTYSFGSLGSGVTADEQRRQLTQATASAQSRMLIPLIGKQNFEYDWPTIVGDATYTGIVGANFVAAPSPLGDNNSWCVYLGGGPAVYMISQNAHIATLKASTLLTTDILQICTQVDANNALLWARINAGNWNGSGTADPASGQGGYNFSIIGAGPYYLAAECGTSTGNVCRVNDGIRPFTNPVPNNFRGPAK